MPQALCPLARTHKLVVTLEDNGVRGGVGSEVSATLRAAEIDVPCRDLGVPQEFWTTRPARGARAGRTDRAQRRPPGHRLVAALGALDESGVTEQID